MVAWRLLLATPECPEGRDIVLIANDLTYLIGSFGPKEDYLFNEASILARQLKCPRVGCIHSFDRLPDNHMSSYSLTLLCVFRSTFHVIVVHASVWPKK